MVEEWSRVNGGKYRLELQGWNFVVERVDDPDDTLYKFQLYESMDRPQSASALEVRIHGHNGTAKTKGNHSGSRKHITDYFEQVNALSYPGIPEPFRRNLTRALELARINLNL